MPNLSNQWILFASICMTLFVDNMGSSPRVWSIAGRFKATFAWTSPSRRSRQAHRGIWWLVAWRMSELALVWDVGASQTRKRGAAAGIRWESASHGALRHPARRIFFASKWPPFPSASPLPDSLLYAGLFFEPGSNFFEKRGDIFDLFRWNSFRQSQKWICRNICQWG